MEARLSSNFYTKMRITKSLDGAYRFNLRVEFRCGWHDLINAVLWKSQREHDSDFLKKWSPSRSSVMNALRKAMASEGYNLWASVEDASEDETTRAQEIVKQLFPELEPKNQ